MYMLLTPCPEGEENVFRQAYEVDLDSDNEDILVDEPGPFKSPGSARGPAQSYRERREALRKMGEANRQVSWMMLYETQF